MAVLNNKKSKVSDEIPSASMADIAFLLLIFFLVTTVFPKDKGLAIVLPEQQEEIEIPAKNIMHILIQPSGVVDVRIGESEQTVQRRPEDIEAIWRQNFAQNPQLIAGVKTHPDASYRHMVDVLDALQSAGADKISLQQLEN